jgi:ubiquinone/menaquinone biosynthesis C-methylase UbiE
MVTLVDLTVKNRWEKEFNKGSHKDYPNIELVRLEKWFFNNKPGKLIEYGFGSGVNTCHMAKCGYSIEGMDATEGAVKTAKLKLTKNNILDNKVKLQSLEPGAEKLPFEDNSFDYAIIISVISLLGNVDRIKLVLSELKRVLKPGGKIIADVNSNNSQFALDGKYMGDNIYVNSGRDKNQEDIFCYCPNDETVFQEIFSQYFKILDIGRSTSILMNNSTDEFIYCGSKD